MNAQLKVSKTEECEAILERYHQAAKDLKFYQIKFKDYSMVKKEASGGDRRAQRPASRP